jgi:hypothetical protein
MFKPANNKDWSDRFAPCAAGRLLLQPLSAVVARAVAQKVLLSTRRLENQPVLNSLHRCSFKRKQMNSNTLKCNGVLRGKTSRQETQQTNLITKGRNQRQINE